jgi:hypothetical protein
MSSGNSGQSYERHPFLNLKLIEGMIYHFQTLTEAREKNTNYGPRVFVDCIVLDSNDEKMSGSFEKKPVEIKKGDKVCLSISQKVLRGKLLDLKLAIGDKFKIEPHGKRKGTKGPYQYHDASIAKE